MADYTTDDVDETARMLGIRRSAAPPPGANNPSSFVTPDDISETARMLGVSPSGSRKNTAPAPAQKKNIVVPGQQAVSPSGKLNYEPGDVITPQEQAAGEQRGIRAQIWSGVPLGEPVEAVARAAIPGGQPGSFGDRYDAIMRDIKRANQAYAYANPVASTAAQIGGGVLGYGGLAAFGPTRALLGMSGPSVGARTAFGTVGNAALSAVDAWARREDPAQAAKIGAAGGLLGPYIGEGVGALSRGALAHAAPAGALSGVPAYGVDLLANRGLGDLTPAEIAAMRAQAGPNALLGDITPGMRDLTKGVGAVQGSGKDVVERAYQDQAAGSRARMDALITPHLGPTNNVINYTNMITDERARVADPLYAQWRSTQVQPTPELKALIPRLQAAGAFNAAQELAAIDGRSINQNFFTGGPQKAYPTTDTWDLVKQGVDRRIDQAYSGGDKRLASSLIKLKGELVGEIEKTPAGQIWKQARQAFADRSSLLDQVAAGRDTFLGGRSGLSADELQEELKGLSPPELTARMVGMRSAIDEGMEATRNGDATTRNKLLAPTNQRKIRSMLEATYPQTGSARADDLLRGLNQEAFLAERVPDVIPNRNTGASAVQRGEAAGLFKQPEPLSWDITRPTTYPVVSRFLPENIIQDFRAAGRARAAPALANILTTREGPRMDALLSDIMAARDRYARAGRAASVLDRGAAAFVAGPLATTYRRYYENQKNAPALSEQ